MNEKIYLVQFWKQELNFFGGSVGAPFVSLQNISLDVLIPIEFFRPIPLDSMFSTRSDRPYIRLYIAMGRSHVSR